MKHKQDNSNAWKKIVLAALFIAVVFGALVFLESGITGLASAPGLKWTNVDKCEKANDPTSNEFIFGEVTSVKKGKTTKLIDVCSKDKKKVTEYYCNSGKKIARKQIECIFGCQNGACDSGAEIIAVAEETPTEGPTGGVGSGGSGGGFSATGGKVWKVGTATKMLEMANNDAPSNSIKGETFNAIASYIGQYELKALASGKFNTGESEYPYNQYLYFSVASPSSTGIIKYVTDSHGYDTADFLYFKSWQEIARYKLEFTAQATSKINGQELSDFKDKKIILFGKEYTLTSALRPTQGSIELTLNDGVKTLKLKDTNIQSDTKYSDNLFVGSESIGGATVIIAGIDDGSQVKLSSIEINITAQDDYYYVPTNGKLSETIKLEGKEEEALFTENWDIEYKGLSAENTHDIGVETSGDKRYNLIWYDGEGYQVKMPLAYAEKENELTLGEDSKLSTSSKSLILKENQVIRKNDYFVINEGGKSYLLQYKGADALTKPTPKIKFKSVGSGDTKQYYPDSAGKVEGASYLVIVGDTAKDDYNLKIDLDMDNIKDEEGIIPIKDKFGAVINILPTSSKIAVSIDTTDETKYDNQKPMTLNWQITADSTGKVKGELLTNSQSNTLITPSGQANVAYGYTSMGGKITYNKPVGSPATFSYNYPAKQRLPQVYITTKTS